MSRRNGNQTNYKSKRRGQTALMIAGIVLIIALLAGIGVMAFSSMRERNPANLIKVDDNYVEDKVLMYGLEVDVNEDGVIKLKGQTSADEQIIVQTVKLAAGTYTLSGIDKPNLNEVVLRATWGNGNVAYAGLDSATFTLDAEYEVTIDILVKGSEDKNTVNWQNKTIKPVLVADDKPGEFWA